MADELKNINNDEINSALQEFEAKSSLTEEQNSGAPISSSKEVEGIKFENESYTGIKFYKETGTPGIVKMVMKASGGTIQEQKHAEYLLMVIVAIIFGVSFYLFFFWGSSNQSNFTPQQEQEIQKMVERMNNPQGIKK